MPLWAVLSDPECPKSLCFKFGDARALRVDLHDGDGEPQCQ